MSIDTTKINQQRQPLDDDAKLWLFGYGSLMYKVDFPYIEAKPGYIYGWQRRFWQGSHDHRGTPESPGRVVTLVKAEPTTRLTGMAYLVAGKTFKQLDIREKNGYLRLETPLYLNDQTRVNALVYIATEDNEAWLGDASMEAMAKQIAYAQGPSGANRDYLLKLAQSLDELGVTDHHVRALCHALQAFKPLK